MAEALHDETHVAMFGKRPPLFDARNHITSVYTWIDAHGDPDVLGSLRLQKFQLSFAGIIGPTDCPDRWAYWKQKCAEAGIAPKPEVK